MTVTVPLALAERERRVLMNLSYGVPTGEISRQLGLSDRTVKQVMHDLNSRFGTRSRAHLVAFAFRNGLIK